MFDCFLAQVLVLAMLFFCSVRIFFLKKARVDCFAVFSPVALVFSLLIFFCFDFTLVNAVVFALALFVFFTNFRSALRLAANLIVDSYSLVFIIFSVLELILIVSLAAVIIIFRPVKYTAKDFGISKTQLSLTGNISNLRIRESYFSGERFSGNLFVYEPLARDEINAELYKGNPVIVFAPGIRATVQNYEPFLMILAQKGYKVISADFYTSDAHLLPNYFGNDFLNSTIESKFLRRFAAIHLENTQEENFKKILEEEKPLATKKYSALTRLALELYGDETKVFYVVDGVDYDSIFAVIEEFNTEPYSNAAGFFAMNRVDEYKTSGYGFIEQTDVLLAKMKGIDRENKFFIPRYVANKTIEAIQEKK
mgnify:CR=1 FL=1